MRNKETVQQETSSCAAGKGVFQRAEKEIYENITQCLCLARMQIASIELHNKEDAMARIGEAGLLVGKAVKDLRNLAKQLSAFHAKLSA
jgi:hypothetical protein